MAETTRLQRRLSTIIAVDVCGYTSMVALNEEQAVISVGAIRAMIGEIAKEYGGRIFNHAGDGVMAETPSAVEGVRAAFKMHRSIAEYNEARPDEPPITVRIGVNLGDVIAKDDGDMMGHGVNIASRLESIAKPGETVISQAVYEQIHGTVDEIFHAAGYEKLKHIDVPIAVYRAQQGSTEGYIPEPELISPTQRRSVLYAVLAALCGAAVLAGIWRFSTPAPTAPQEQTIAVLPFVNIGEDPDNQFFSDGITQEIISTLVRMDDVKVIGQTSSFMFGNGEDAAAELQGRLRVSHILEGSVRREGNRVRVMAQLIDTDQKVNLWSEVYEQDMDDIFVLQQEIAQRIAKTLQVSLSPVSATEAQAIDPVTYELYLRGRSLLNQRGASIPQAVSFFETVIARDDGFADGWAGLASALYLLPGYTDVSYAEVAQKVETTARQALLLNPKSAEALSVLAALERQRSEWLAADQRFLKALAIEPNNVAVMSYYGEFLLSVGRFADALAIFEKAYEIDPLSPYTSAGVGWAKYFAGDNDGALEAFSRAWDEYGLKSAYIWEGLFTVYVEQGDYEKVLAIIEQTPGSGASKPLYRRFVAAVKDPDGIEAEALPGVFAAMEKSMDLPFYWRYETYLRLGKNDDALAAVLSAVRKGPIKETQVLFSPSGTAVWDNPKFETLADELGLIEYWQATNAPDLCKGTRVTINLCVRAKG